MLQKRLQISRIFFAMRCQFQDMRQCGCSCRNMYVYVKLRQVCGILYQWILVKKCSEGIDDPLYYNIFPKLPQVNIN
jgi:hypothetical protein